MITELRLHNVGPYRGIHTLNLKSSVYAIVARHDADPGRSNFSGKSFLLEMIDFAVTGRLNKTRPGGADGWISKGEKKGSVRLTLEDGVTFFRERSRGQSTQVRMVQLNGSMASQAEAETAILKHLHLDEDDFQTVGYFEQGQMSRIIHTRAELRMEAVRGWIDLRQAEHAETNAATVASTRIKELQKRRARHDVLTSFDTSSELLDLEKLKQTRAHLTKQIEANSTKRIELTQIQNHEKVMARYRECLQEKKTLAAAVAEIPDHLDEEVAQVQEAVAHCTGLHAEAQQVVRTKNKVALGLFDGKCPVASIECPATKQINKDRVSSNEALKEAKERYTKASFNLQTAHDNAEEVLQRQALASQQRRDLKRVQQEIDRLKPGFLEAKQAVKDIGIKQSQQDLMTEYRDLQQRQQETVEAIADVQAKQAQRAQVVLELTTSTTEIQKANQSAAVAIQTRSIFKATQRRVAEKVLNTIGSRANHLLSEAGIDLSVDIQWEREGKNYAKACEMCGSSFPTSTKIKSCETCGAERGQNIIHKLQFLMSDQSGGAHDLGGISLQLAAGSWLLHKRQSCWDTVMLDEPMAALDKTIRRSMSKQFMGLLQSTSYRQAFIISHAQETVDMYPSIITVCVAKDGSRRIEQS